MNELGGRLVRFAEVGPWLLETTGHRISRLSVSRDEDAWKEVLAALEEREPFDEDDAAAPASQPPRTVPKTSLRHWYEHLRDFPAIEIHRQKCQSICARNDAESNLLDELFASSVRELESYSNESEPFHARKAPTWRARFREQPDRFAHWVVAQVAPGHVNWFEIERVASRVRAVDYELYTLRTTGGAVFPDGTQVRRGGSGGLDLLLDWGGTPVVGEVKAKGDTNAFLALVQALVYASELATPAQLRRLRTCYRDHFGALKEDARVGIAIISDGTKSPHLYEEAKALAQQVMAPGGPIAQRVRFIAFISGTPDNSNNLQLTLDELFES